jgi:hypothetical protein
MSSAVAECGAVNRQCVRPAVPDTLLARADEVIE